MTAMNIVHMRVKPGKDDEFIAIHESFGATPMAGIESFDIVKTGERSYCFVGEWASFGDIAAARPSMIALLDTFRDELEDLGGGLGVTDPVSGEVVIDLKP